MPLLTSGLRVGPRGSATPPDIGAYLTSIGKTWYGTYDGGYGLTSASAGGGSSVVGVDGSAVGSWLPRYTSGGFNTIFHNTNNTFRPTLGTAGTAGVYGDATTTFLFADSMTWLNRDMTICLSLLMRAVNGHRWMSANVLSGLAVISPTSLSGAPSAYVGGVNGMRTPTVAQYTIVDATYCSVKIAFDATGISYHNRLLNLFRSSDGTGYADIKLYGMSFSGLLGHDQKSAALSYLSI